MYLIWCRKFQYSQLNTTNISCLWALFPIDNTTDYNIRFWAVCIFLLSTIAWNSNKQKKILFWKNKKKENVCMWVLLDGKHKEQEEMFNVNFTFLSFDAIILMPSRTDFSYGWWWRNQRENQSSFNLCVDIMGVRRKNVTCLF